MDTTTFDTLTRTLTTSTTRRSALRGLVAGAAATAVGAGLLLGSGDTSAKRRKGGKKGGKKSGKGQAQKLQPGTRCQSDSQCTTGYICEVPVNGSYSDEYCSGGQGAVCGAPNGDGDDTFPFCAVGFDCTPTGNRYTCQAVPDEI